MIQHRKRGQDHIFTAQGQGYDVRVTVAGHGYEFTVASKADYAAMTDEQVEASRIDLADALVQAAAQSDSLRHHNPPLFDLTSLKGQTKGINEL